MKNAMKWAFAVLLSAVAWTYAADSLDVKLSVSDKNGNLYFWDKDKGGCSFEETKDYFTESTGKCPQGAVIKVKAGATFKSLLKLKCWQSSDVCVSTDEILELKVSSDTVLQALFEKTDIDSYMRIPDYLKYSQFPVFGRDSLEIESNLYFENRDYIYIVYQYNSGDGYKNMINPVKILREEGLPEELSVISFSRNFETEINANEKVWSHSFKKDSTVYFRVAAAFNENALINHTTDVVYSEDLSIFFHHPIVFESVSGVKIRSRDDSYGREVYFSCNKSEIEVPADDDEYIYDYRWHRVGASGKEYLSSDVRKIIVGDSVHYKAELIKLPKELPEIAFTVTGIEVGHSAKDVKIGTPNECFIVSDVELIQGNKVVEGTLKQGEGFGFMQANVTISEVDSCTGNLQANLWRYYAKDNKGAKIYTVNGLDEKKTLNKDFNVFFCNFSEVVFLDDYAGNVLKREIVAEGLSVTPPEAPKREGYVFKGWDTDKFDHVTEDIGFLTVVAQYEKVESSSSTDVASSSSEAKSSSSNKEIASSSSSSSKNKSSSSSSKGKGGKSSSSKGGKDAIVAVQQMPQFSLVAAGRDIQVAGARMGSAYAVFDIQGHVMVKGRVAAANFDVPVSRAGSYLVRIGNQVQKVNIK